MQPLNTAILIPCFNEEATIAQVVDAFHTAVPSATIYVYDNNSMDKTVEIAKSHGAIVCKEKRQGKGAVVRRMFADIEADVYVMVDGDHTYDASMAVQAVDHLLDYNLDMLNISRIPVEDGVYRSGHRLGNFLLTGIVKLLFGSNVQDMLSGYRVFSRRFVKTFPARSNGFEIETELTVHSLEMGLPIDEVTAEYRSRPEDSESKLSTYKDGAKILLVILKLLFSVRPIFSFLILALLFLFSSLIVGWVQVLQPLIEYGEITKMPSVILASSLMLLSLLSLVSGVIVSSITKMRRDVFRLAYLRIQK